MALGEAHYRFGNHDDALIAFQTGWKFIPEGSPAYDPRVFFFVQCLVEEELEMDLVKLWWKTADSNWQGRLKVAFFPIHHQRMVDDVMRYLKREMPRFSD